MGGRPDAGVQARGDLRPGDAPAPAGRPAEPAREDPGDEARPRRDRGLHRRGQEHQRHADLLAAALPRGSRVVHPRARAARRGGRGSDEGRVGRELLRLASRHRGGQAPRRDRRPRRPEGEARHRERAPRVRALQGSVLRRALGGAGREGRNEAALPVGLHFGQEPGLPRRHVRRGADRARHR